MKKMKRFLSLVLATALVCTLLPTTASAGGRSITLVDEDGTIHDIVGTDSGDGWSCEDEVLTLNGYHGRCIYGYIEKLVLAEGSVNTLSAIYLDGYGLLDVEFIDGELVRKQPEVTIEGTGELILNFNESWLRDTGYYCWRTFEQYAPHSLIFNCLSKSNPYPSTLVIKDNLQITGGSDVWDHKSLVVADKSTKNDKILLAETSDGTAASYVRIGPATEISEYIYNVQDPSTDMTLPTELLDGVTDTDSAMDAVRQMVDGMTTEQKESATGIDLATLYAETAVAKAARKSLTGNNILINAAQVADMETVTAQTSAAVETALTDGGITVARQIADTVTLTTDAAGEITIQIDPDILTTQVDKVRVETPTYALTFKVADLEEDLTGVLTFTAEDTGTGYAPGQSNSKTTVKVTMPNGKTSNPVTLSLPADSGSTTYQAVVTTEGTATSSKYNPATTTMDGKVTTSGNYTVQTNEKDFTDISNKSAEMQAAIRYLASKGIITGTTETSFSPDASISRAEIAALLVRALGKLDSGATASFNDVTRSNWFYSAAASSQKHGLINGYSHHS